MTPNVLVQKALMSIIGGMLGAVVFSVVAGLAITHTFPLGWLAAGAIVGLVLSFAQYRAIVDQRVLDGFRLKIKVAGRSLLSDIIWSFALTLLLELLIIGFFAATPPVWNGELWLMILGSSLSVSIFVGPGSWLLSQTVAEPQTEIPAARSGSFGGTGALVRANFRMATSPASEDTNSTITRITEWWAAKPWWFQDAFLLGVIALAVILAFNLTGVLGQILHN